MTGFVKGAEVASDSNNYGGGGARCLFTSYLIVHRLIGLPNWGKSARSGCLS